MTDGKLRHWIRTAIDKWTDVAALIGGLLGIVLIAGVVMTGLHERQLPLAQEVSPAASICESDLCRGVEGSGRKIRLGKGVP
jgi:hypothetical protein